MALLRHSYRLNPSNTRLLFFLHFLEQHSWLLYCYCSDGKKGFATNYEAVNPFFNNRYIFSSFCSALLIRLITSQYAETESALLKDITARLFLLHARNNRSLRLFSYSISVSDVRNANVSFRYSFNRFALKKIINCSSLFEYNLVSLYLNHTSIYEIVKCAGK